MVDQHKKPGRRPGQHTSQKAAQRSGLSSVAAASGQPAYPSRQQLWGILHLSWRGLLTGAIGSIVITASSMYVALKMSALPWPTIFVAVLSMALLKLLGQTNLHEINVAQTGMSAGAMVAGGLAFTIPGFWIAGIFQPYDPAAESFAAWFWPKFWPVLLVAMAGMILGSLLCWYFRPRFIDQEALPYPIGTAAADTLKAGDQGGGKARILFATLGLTAVFTAVRDKVAGFPQLIGTTIWQIPVGVALQPMAIGIGYIIGLNYTAYWLAGALFSAVVLTRLGLLWSVFADQAAVSAFNLTAAVGLMVGSGVGILLSFLYHFFRRPKAARQPDKTAAGISSRNTGRQTLQASAPPPDKKATGSRPATRRWSLGLLLVISAGLAFVLTVLAGLSLPVAALTMLGVILATAMAATITGQSGINPMEIFGIIVLLAIRLLLPVDASGALLIAAIVAVACGYAGDLLNDYKAGALLGTNPNAQLVSQILGGVIGAIVAAIAMFAVIYQYGGVGGNTGLTAAQAFSVSALVSGLGSPFVFLVAALLGGLLYWHKVPAMIIGIGMLLPIHLSYAIVLGGLARAAGRLWRKRRPASADDSDSTGQVIAAGMLGGEGITGVILAIITMFSR